MFAKKEDLHKTISRAMDAILYIGDLNHSLDEIDALYSKESFENEEKFGLLLNTAMEVQERVAFARYRGAEYYVLLKKVIVYLHIARSVFRSASIAGP